MLGRSQVQSKTNPTVDVYCHLQDKSLIKDTKSVYGQDEKISRVIPYSSFGAVSNASPIVTSWFAGGKNRAFSSIFQGFEKISQRFRDCRWLSFYGLVLQPPRPPEMACQCCSSFPNDVAASAPEATLSFDQNFSCPLKISLYDICPDFCHLPRLLDPQCLVTFV